jgi:hypothetical protein
MQAYHTGVFGDSGGGKTTLLREMHDRFSGPSIVVDTTMDGVSGFAGTRVASVSDAQRAVRTAGAWDTVRLVWRTRAGDQAMRDGRTIRQFAHKLAEQSKAPVQVIVDEAQNVLSEGQVGDDYQNPYQAMLHEDRDKGLKVVVASQDPQDLAYGPLKQATRYVWVGRWSSFHEGFFRYFKINTEDLPDQKYQYVTLNRRMNVVEKGETNEEYA